MSATTPTVEVDLENVLQLVVRFLDLSRDLDRNEDDAAFAAQKEIVYVFDENLMEIFVRPRDPRGQAASFYGSDWGWDNKSDRSAASTALVVAEYLFSGALPGQRNGIAYMTSWHRQESVSRMSKLFESHQKLVRRQISQSQSSFVADLEKLRRDLNQRFAKSDRGVVESSLLHADLRRILGDAQEFSEEALFNIAATSLAVGSLALDKVIEPLEQLKRVVTPPLRNLFCDVHERYRPNAQQVSAMADDAARWHRRLTNEVAAHGVSREPAALMNDAKSLAFICWASREAVVSRGERLVLVTADAVMFDAYRRWYSEVDVEDPAMLQPFALRRWSQYGPMFNLNDAGLLGEPRRDLLATLREAVEVTLLPFNMSRLTAKASKRPEYFDARQREFLALKLKGDKSLLEDESLKPFVRFLERNWIQQQSRQLNALKRRWRDVEQLTLGIASPFVERRLSKRQSALMRQFGAPTDLVDRNRVEAYVSELYHRILEGSLDVWAPVASEFILEFRPSGAATPPRVPMALRLSLPMPEGHEALTSAISSIMGFGDVAKPSSEVLSHRLRGEYELLFALAAGLALASEKWKRAADFASRALAAFVSRARHRMTGLQGVLQLCEFRHLLALARRFSLGDIGVPGSETSARIVTNIYYETRTTLQSILDELANVKVYSNIITALRARAISERAALSMFYAVALGLRAEEPLTRQASEASAIRVALENAARDLLDCRALMQTIDLREEDFPERLRRQYIPNSAACIVYGEMLGVSGSSIEALRTPDILKAIEQFEKSLDATSRPLLRLEVETCLAICGLKPEGLSPDIGPLPKTRQPGLTRLDRASFDAMLAWARAKLDVSGLGVS